MDEVQKRKPWLTHKTPEPWAALVMSDNTRNFYGRSPGQVEERYMANVFGTFRAAVEEHLPVTVINDWNLNADDLAKYKVLILPNTACLDDGPGRRRSTQFVAQRRRPGRQPRHVAVRRVRRPREQLRARRRVRRRLPRPASTRPAAAKDDLDVNFAKSIGPDYWEKRKNVFDFQQDAGSFLNQGKMKTYVGDEPVTFKGPAVRVAVNASRRRRSSARSARRTRRRAGRFPACRHAHLRQGPRRLPRRRVRRGLLPLRLPLSATGAQARRSSGPPPPRRR